MSGGFYTVKGYNMLRAAGQQQDGAALSGSMEDYLEMIARLSLESGHARVAELAEKLNVNASSASKMARRLGELGYVEYAKYNIIKLTEKGRETGGYLLRRHEVVRGFLTILTAGGVNMRELELIEHCLEPQTIERLEALCGFWNSKPELAPEFEEYLKSAD